MRDRVTVRVPATTANLGPGFDCLAMALDIWNTVTVEVGSPGFSIEGYGEDRLRRGRTNLVYRCLRMPFVESKRQFPPVAVSCFNEIPVGNGLGSSAAAAVGGLVAGNALCGDPLTNEELLELASKVEGHADNASAALLGGLQIVVRDGKRLVTSSVAIPEDLRAVLFVPDAGMPTREARALLPTSVDRRDAVYNIGRVGLLVNAFGTGDLTHLAAATSDRLHQDARQSVFPAMKNIFRAAMSAGALAVFLSGAGSAILALTRGRELTVGYEMADAADKSGVPGDVKVTRPTARGAHVVEIG